MRAATAQSAKIVANYPKQLERLTREWREASPTTKNSLAKKVTALSNNFAKAATSLGMKLQFKKIT
jgi:hypothetical protein